MGPAIFLRLAHINQIYRGVCVRGSMCAHVCDMCVAAESTSLETAWVLRAPVNAPLTGCANLISLNLIFLICKMESV